METSVQEYERYVPDQSQVNIAPMICRGVVESNNDPYRMGRVQVRIPFLHGVPGVTPTAIESNKLPWAPICSLSAGQGRGTVLTPMIGDAVFVGFEDGRKDKPVVLGCCFSTGVENGKKFTGSTSDMFKHTEGIKQLRTEKSDIPDQSRHGDSAQILYKSAKGGQISFEDKDEAETIRLIDRIGQIIEMGTDCPSETQTRPKGDRSRKDELPKEGLYDKGYIHLHSAAQHGRDPGFHITEDYVQGVNGTSLFSMDQDHVILANYGGEVLSTRNRPESRKDEDGNETESESTAQSLDSESISNISSAASSVGGDIGNISSQTSNIQAQVSNLSAISSVLSSAASNTIDTASSAKALQASANISARASAIQANAATITKGTGVISGCFGGNGVSNPDLLSTIGGLVGANAKVAEAVNAISKVQSALSNISKIAEGIGKIDISNIGNIGNIGGIIGNMGNIGGLGKIGNMGELGSVTKSLTSNITNSASSMTSSVGNVAGTAGAVSGMLSQNGGVLDIVGDQVTLKNSGCSIQMIGGAMTIQATNSITLVAPRIMLNY